MLLQLKTNVIYSNLMMETSVILNLEEVKADLLKGIYQCSVRGLMHSTKWSVNMRSFLRLLFLNLLLKLLNYVLPEFMSFLLLFFIIHP